MLLTITCEAERATDFGYLLHKNPASVYERALSFGVVRVFYPEASDSRCTAALLLEIDPIGLVRGRGSSLDQYVNDRPYVASSLMSVAIGEAFRTTLSGRSSERPERVDEKLPLRATLSAVDCDGGEPLIRRLFEPLEYAVTVSRAPLDPRFPEWGESSLYSLTIEGRESAQNLLAHLYVLIPVLDNAKHYFVGQEEIEKLLRRGEGWLSEHPERDLITRRYLLYRRPFVEAALARMRDDAAEEEQDEERNAEEEQVERPIRLNEMRMDAVRAAVMEIAPKRVLDLGCGEGNLIGLLLEDRSIDEIVGADVSSHVLARAEQRLKLDRLPERQRARVRLIQGSLVYRDDRFSGFDAATLVEVIEHLDPPRLRALEQVVFRYAQPKRVIVTTPNAEYNAVWTSLPAGKLRHKDHRFEWTRTEFVRWAEAVAVAHGYSVRIAGIGPENEALGTPTQMAVFDARA